jgi:hypothetical protein
MIKKTTMFILIALILFLNSCIFEGGEMFRYSDNETRADARMEQIISTIKDKDKEALKSLFSNKILDEASDLEDEIDYFFDFLQGNIVSWEKDSWASSEAMAHGKKSLMIRFGFKIVTDVDEYDFFVIDYNIDTMSPDNEGVYMVQLRKLSYEGSWGGSWQERMRAGIFIQE